MRIVALKELPVRHLEHVFVPAGLPLIRKGERVPPTSSILIRGGAGAGKTTLAVALGHALARAGGGALLYLTTEFSQAELLYKAQFLGIPENAVVLWGERYLAQVGGIVTEHLALRPAGQGSLTSAERKASAIEVVWELLQSGNESPPAVPVRAVVIDAFALPDFKAEERTLRTDLVSFVQGLEGDGVSTILIEESAPAATSWLPFVMDLVFELEWAADPGSGDLRRKLRCPKNRYARALAGPHDYGLEGDVPAVWPDLLSIAAMAEREPVLRVTQPAAWISPVGNGYARFTRGGIVLTPEWSLHHAQTLRRTPGVLSVEVRCGIITTITGPSPGSEVRLFDVGDIQVLGWTLLRLVHEQGVNTVFFRDVEAWLRRAHLEMGLLHVLEALRSLGVLVIAQVRPDAEATLSSLADLIYPGMIARNERAWPLAGLRSAALWVADPLVWIRSEERLLPRPSLFGTGNARASIMTGLIEIMKRAEAGQFREIRDELPRILHTINAESSRDLHLDWALASCRVGASTSALSSFTGWADPGRRSALLSLAALIGRDRDACSALIQEMGTSQEASGMDRYWTAMCALHAASEPALHALEKSTDTLEQAHCIGVWLRALEAHGRTAKVARLAQRFASFYSTRGVTLQRLLAEARLFAPDEAARSAATDELATLAEDPAVPRLHRADTAHNLGVVFEERGDREAALRWYQQALEQNPLLDTARDAAHRLGAAVPPL